MKKTTIAGFQVKDLGRVDSKLDETVKCWKCNKYGKQSTMVIKDKRNYCKDC